MPPAPMEMRLKEENRRVSWAIVGDLQLSKDDPQGGGFASGTMVVNHRSIIPYGMNFSQNDIVVIYIRDPYGFKSYLLPMKNFNMWEMGNRRPTPREGDGDGDDKPTVSY